MNLLGHENFINEHCDAEDLLNQVGSQIEEFGRFWHYLGTPLMKTVSLSISISKPF